MRRSLSFLTATALVLAACGGDDASTQEQTEQGAVDAAVSAMRATFRGDADGVIAFANEACRETIDKQEVQFGLLFLRGLMEDSDFELSEVEIVGTIDDFDGDSATVELSYETPESSGNIEDLLFTTDEIDMVYEKDRWVSTECDFGDDTSEADTNEARDAELQALGVAGTQDDPAPTGAALTVGNNFRIIMGSYNPDAAAEVEAATGFTPFVEEGQTVGRLEYTLIYEGDEEPISASEVGIDAFGADGVGLAVNSCNYPGDLDFSDRVFSGAVVSTSACLVGTPEQLLNPLVATRIGFDDADLFFDPLTAAPTTDTFTTAPGPSATGSAADDRAQPNPIGTPIDVDNGWTITVDGAELDGAARAEAESDFFDPPAPGRAFSLVDLTLSFDGDTATSPFQLTMIIVGDDNIGRGIDCGFSGLPGELELFNDLLPGATTTGTVCFDTDAASLDSLVLAVTSDSFDQDWEYFALR